MIQDQEQSRCNTCYSLSADPECDRCLLQRARRLHQRVDWEERLVCIRKNQEKEEVYHQAKIAKSTPKKEPVKAKLPDKNKKQSRVRYLSNDEAAHLKKLGQQGWTLDDMSRATGFHRSEICLIMWRKRATSEPRIALLMAICGPAPKRYTKGGDW